MAGVLELREQHAAKAIAPLSKNEEVLLANALNDCSLQLINEG